MKRIRKKFTVEGSGVFPFDMLRYDACWPRSEATDSLALQAGLYGEGAPKRQVTLLTDSVSSPTIRRWESFTWRVLNTEIVV
jgi:hypothetical protein